MQVVPPQVIHRWHNANDSMIIVTPNGVISADDEHARLAAYELDSKRLTEFRTKKGMDLKALTFKDSTDRYQAHGATGAEAASTAAGEGKVGGGQFPAPAVPTVRDL